MNGHEHYAARPQLSRLQVRSHRRTRGGIVSEPVKSSSKAVSAQYGVRCPTCGAGPYWPCRSRRSLRITDTHAARIDAQHEQWMAER